MVKRLLLICTLMLSLSSCAFFGASVFSTATSMDIGWFINNGGLRYFYILDNGKGDEFLFLVNDSGGSRYVLIFDTSLNLRGFMEDGQNGVLTDGTGFVDHNGDFIIGQTKISRQGTADPGEIAFVPVPDAFATSGNSDSYVYRWEHPSVGTPFYMRIEQNANISVYDLSWNILFGPFIMPNNLTFVINQSDPDKSDLVLADMGGGIYNYTKDELFEHASNAVPLPNAPPDIYIDNGSLTQWVTRCSKGFFVSTTGEDENAYILYDNDGDEIDRIEGNSYVGEIVTIDYDGEYYYAIDWDKNIIRKERAPYWAR